MTNTNARARVSRRSKARRIVGLTEADVVAAQRLLLLLGGAEISPTSSGKSEQDRQRSIDRASVLLALRQNRIRLFGDSLSADPPFQILLALFVSERTEPMVTVTRLTNLTSLPSTTALRWLEPLERGGWIKRTGVAKDRRMAKISLTGKARKTIDELVDWPGQ